MIKRAYHGGSFFSAVGDDFSTLEKSKNVVNADVLDAWFDPSPQVIDKVIDYLPYLLKTSPPTHADGLIKTISQCREVSEVNVMVGGGSSDLIYLLLPALLKRNDTVLLLDPTYGEYQFILENILGAYPVHFQLSSHDDFFFDLDSFLAAIRKNKPNMIILVNPNNPTGTYIEDSAVCYMLEQISPDIPVLVDETYIEYVGPEKSLEKRVASYPNLIVLKSMSKAYALSGIRVGYLVADRGVIEKVSILQPPWNIGTIAQLAGIEALKDKMYYSEKYRETYILREEIVSHYKKVPKLKVFPSVVNFFLIDTRQISIEAERIALKMIEKDVFVRHYGMRAQDEMNYLIRIAVKNRSTNFLILDTFRWALNQLSGDSQ